MGAEIKLRRYDDNDLESMRNIWNTVVLEANAFPQREPLKAEECKSFFSQQSYTGVAEIGGEVVGLYILHPNNVGRCGHICNASYAVNAELRGHGIGERLVRDCIEQGRRLGFRILQFNAVVSSNASAIHLYEKIGFQRIGVVPKGFQLNDGKYEDIILFYFPLV